MLGFVLVRPNALLQAASNVAAVADAARADDLPAVRKLIKEHADVNAPANDGSSALLWAAYHSNVEMTKALLAAGAAVDAANHYGVTPLLQASRNGDVEVMRALLDAGAEPTRWHAEGETPLMAASRTGNVDAVQLLLSHGSFVNAADPFQEETALMWASAEGHLEVVKALLAAGADPNLKAHVSTITERKNADHPSGGFTALMFAVRNGHEDVAKALIAGRRRSEADQRRWRDRDHRRHRQRPVRSGQGVARPGRRPQRRILVLRRRHARRHHRHARARRLPAATQPSQQADILGSGEVAARPERGREQAVRRRVALDHAVLRRGDQQLAVLPRRDGGRRGGPEADAGPTARRSSGARARSSPRTAKPAGRPNPNAGKTPLMAAIKGGQGAPIAGGPGFTRIGPPVFREPGSRDPLEALNLLLAAGADPNAKAADGSTPLHQAVQEEHVAMIRALAAAGGKLDAVNKDNLTPLLLAEAPKKPNPADMGDLDVYKPKRDSKEEVVAALRELMHLGPNDPAPQPPPLPADKTTRK